MCLGVNCDVRSVFNKGFSRERNFSPSDVHSVSAASGEPLDAARVGFFHLRLQLCTETVLVYAQQKTEVEKLNAFGRERFLQLRPGCQVPPVSPE